MKRPVTNRKEAADRLKVSTATISRWENGLVMPDDEKKIEIAEAYGVAPETIFPLKRVRL